MEFWINYKEKNIFQLPIPPKSFNIKKGNSISTANIINIGEVGVIGKGLLADIEISSFFPKNKYHFQNGEFKDPQYYITFLESVRKDELPLRLIITDSDINSLFMIVSFSYGVQDGTKDIYYSLVLKEYRTLSVATIPKANASGVKVPTVSTRPVTKVTPTTYKVVAGDSLWLIAKKQLQDGSRWQEIYDKNKDIIKNPNQLTVGWVLKL